MRHPAGIRDIPSGDGVSEVDIREEKMKTVCLPDHLQRAGSDGGLKHAPSLLAKNSAISSRTNPSSSTTRAVRPSKGFVIHCFHVVHLENAPGSQSFSLDGGF